MTPWKEKDAIGKRGGRCKSEGLGAPKPRLPLHKFPKPSPWWWSKMREKISKTSPNYQSFWKTDKCHSLIVWKGNREELAQELSETHAILHTAVITSFNPSLMLGDMAHPLHFSGEKTEAYSTSTWAYQSSLAGRLTHSEWTSSPALPSWSVRPLKSQWEALPGWHSHSSRLRRWGGGQISAP